MVEARIRVAVCLGGQWQTREQRLPCGLLDEDEAEKVAREVVQPDDVGGIVEVGVPGWRTYFRVELVRFYGLGLNPISYTEREQVEQFFEELVN